MVIFKFDELRQIAVETVAHFFLLYIIALIVFLIAMITYLSCIAIIKRCYHARFTCREKLRVDRLSSTFAFLVNHARSR